MAKTAKKKQAVADNPRSRAAKRASSPSINVDKSIKDTPSVTGTSPMLGVTANAGVRKPRARQMSRNQKARQEKGLARAEAVMDQMEKKVDGARAKIRKRHSRKALWEDVNDATVDEQRKAVKGPGRGLVAAEALGQENQPEPDQDQGDIDMGSGAKIEIPAISTSTNVKQDETDEPSNQQSPPNPEPDESDMIT